MLAAKTRREVGKQGIVPLVDSVVAVEGKVGPPLWGCVSSVTSVRVSALLVAFASPSGFVSSWRKSWRRSPSQNWPTGQLKHK